VTALRERVPWLPLAVFTFKQRITGLAVAIVGGLCAFAFFLAKRPLGPAK